MSENMAMDPRNSTSVYRLIVRQGSGDPELLTIDLDGMQTLPIFSWEEEARMYLRLGWFEETGWRIAMYTSEKLVSMLAKNGLTGVRFVALDPLPELISQGMIGLVSMNKEQFVGHLVERAEFEEVESLVP